MYYAFGYTWPHTVSVKSVQTRIIIIAASFLFRVAVLFEENAARLLELGLSDINIII